MSETRKGLIAMLGACLIWGCMPLIYKPLAHVPPVEVFVHRVIWSLAFFVLVLWGQGRLGRVRAALGTRRTLSSTFLASLMISVNWFLIIYATAVGRNTEGSLGYYVYPLLAVLLGRVIFAERMSAAQWLAVALAAAGVAVLSLGLAALPWIALALATSFACYGVIKKRSGEDALVSVTAELVVFLPLALVLLGALQMRAGLTFGSDPFDSLYVMVAGPLTALPLILFSYAARRVRMSTIGLMQYINPTLQFLTAVLLFGEPFGTWHAVAFALIWCALALYSASAWRQDSAERRRARAASGVSARP